ncbi:MAG: calcium/sodium antiporter [Oscillospiraceae bacterium]|nr:calcium/sodium antiporter [Oscillospiraceae bacterium]
MNILLNILLLVVGFVALIKGADFFVDGAASLARKLKIPSLIVGLTIVAMGTSAPEMAVSVSSSIKGSNALAISNVIGSNIFNMMVVLGVCAAIAPIAVNKDVIKRDFPVNIAAVVLFMVFLLVSNGITRLFGFILFAGLIAYIIFSIRAAKSNPTEDEPPADFSPLKCALFIIGGAAGIVIGGDLVVDNAQAIALAAGMSETLVGLTICAVGTSLPELVTSITATKKGENDMAVGNVVGSNLFNVLGIIGISGLISPIELGANAHDSLVDSVILTVFTVICFVFSLTGLKITRIQGILLVFLYVAYMAFAILRNYGFVAI